MKGDCGCSEKMWGRKPEAPPCAQGENERGGSQEASSAVHSDWSVRPEVRLFVGPRLEGLYGPLGGACSFS